MTWRRMWRTTPGGWSLRTMLGPNRHAKIAGMGINSTEVIVIALILILIVGPDKLPELASQLGRLIREVKAIATGAKARVQEELGPDFDELKNLDPRQYDPRRIVRDALKDDPPARVPSRTSRPVSTPRTTPAAAASAPSLSETAASAPAEQRRETVPFDDEAT